MYKCTFYFRGLLFYSCQAVLMSVALFSPGLHPVFKS
jgi:hypothetical protein